MKGDEADPHTVSFMELDNVQKNPQSVLGAAISYEPAISNGLDVHQAIIVSRESKSRQAIRRSTRRVLYNEWPRNSMSRLREPSTTITLLTAH